KPDPSHQPDSPRRAHSFNTATTRSSSGRHRGASLWRVLFRRPTARLPQGQYDPIGLPKQAPRSWPPTTSPALRNAARRHSIRLLSQRFLPVPQRAGRRRLFDCIRTAQLRPGPVGSTLLPPAFAELITSGNVALPPSAAPTEPASQTLFYGNGHLDAIAIAQEHIDSESAAGRCADVAAEWAFRCGVPGHCVATR